MTVVGEKMRVALPLGWSALGLAGLALATGLGWLYLALVRDIDDMVRSTIAQFMGTLPLFIGLGLFSFRGAGRRSLRNIPCGLRARNAWLCVWI
jgi:hypothetical protein